MLTEISQHLLHMIAGMPPAAGFLAIIVATFILEDVAIAGTALLAGGGMLDPYLGISALLTGIIIGDIGLFWLGRGAGRLPILNRYVDTQTAQSMREIGGNRIFSLVFTTRFVPGMRLPTYSGLGYVGAPFLRFAAAVLVAVATWTIALYTTLLFLGQAILDSLGPWKWAAIVVIVGVIYLVERHLVRRRKSTKNPTPAE